MTRLLQVMAGAPTWAELFFSRLAIALSEIKYSQKVVIRKNTERSRQLKEITDATEMPFGGALDFLTLTKLRNQLLIINRG